MFSGVPPRRFSDKLVCLEAQTNWATREAHALSWASGFQLWCAVNHAVVGFDDTVGLWVITPVRNPSPRKTHWYAQDFGTFCTRQWSVLCVWVTRHAVWSHLFRDIAHNILFVHLWRLCLRPHLVSSRATFGRCGYLHCQEWSEPGTSLKR